MPVSQVLATVRAATAITHLPKNLTPALTSAGTDSGADSRKCHANQPQTAVTPCAYGDLAGTSTIVLYGDSHAGMWLPAMILVARRTHRRLLMLEKNGCPVADMGLWDFQDRRANTECDTWHTWAMNKIATLRPALVVITTLTDKPRDHDGAKISPAAFFAGMQRTIKILTPATKRIVYLGDMPYLAQVGPDCLAAHESDVQSCSTARAKAVTPATSYIAAHTSSLGAPVIDPTPWLCTATTCPAVIGNYEVYRNQFHLTDTYSAYLSGALGASLGQV